MVALEPEPFVVQPGQVDAEVIERRAGQRVDAVEVFGRARAIWSAFDPAGYRSHIVDRGSAFAARTMIHAGDHVEPRELARGGGSAHRGGHRFVIVDRGRRHDRMVGPALDQDQPRIVVAKGAQVGVVGCDHGFDHHRIAAPHGQVEHRFGNFTGQRCIAQVIADPVEFRTFFRPAPVVELFDHADLRSGEARAGVSRLAQQLAGLEAAPARIADQPVADPVVHVALPHDRGVDQQRLAIGQDRAAIGSGVEGINVRNLSRLDPAERVQAGGCDRNDSVEIFGEALRLDQPLPAAGGTGEEIGFERRLAVKRADQCLARDRGDVRRAVAEIDEPHQIVVDPGVVDQRGVMPHVGNQAGIAIAHMPPASQFNRSCPAASAAAAHQVTPVPVVDRQIHAEAVAGVHIAFNRAIGLTLGGGGLDLGFDDIGSRAGQSGKRAAFERGAARSLILGVRRRGPGKEPEQHGQQPDPRHGCAPAQATAFHAGWRPSRNA